MENFITEGGFRTLSMVFVVGGLVVLLAAENLRPLRARRKARPGRYLTNAVITGLAMLAGAMAVRPVGLGLAYLSQKPRLSSRGSSMTASVCWTGS